jgi:hypothetical protein
MKKESASSWAVKLESLPYDKLEKYVATGDEKLLDADLRQYIDQLNTVRQAVEKYRSQDEIVRMLGVTYPELSSTHCRTLYADAINFFYSDLKVKKKAWRNLLASRLETLSILAIERDDLETARRMIQTMTDLLQLGVPDDEREGELDPLRNDARPVIYTPDPKVLNLPSKVNRVELKKLIKSFHLTKAEQEKVMRDTEPNEPLNGFEDGEPG